MPTPLGRGALKPKKAILTPDQVALLLVEAQSDNVRGMYYAFPFFVGSRPSEQLGLRWRDIDLNQGVIHIRRIQ